MTHDPMRTRPKSQKNTTGGSLWCQDTLGERPYRSPVVTGNGAAGCMAAHQALADPRAHATATTSMAGTPLR
jgi:hypothetical protein